MQRPTTRSPHIAGQGRQPSLNGRGSLDRGVPPQTDAGSAAMLGNHGNWVQRPRVLDDNALHEKRPAIGSAPQLFALEHRGSPLSNVTWKSLEKHVDIDHALQHQVWHHKALSPSPT